MSSFQPRGSSRERVTKRVFNVAAGFLLISSGLSALSALVSSKFPSSPASRILVQPAAASIFKKMNKFTIKEKLSNVPVFAIVNRSGNFYLSIKEDGSQEGVFYTSYEDASDMLFEMLQSPYIEGDARILITPLDKAYELVKNPRPTGRTNDLGEPEFIEFKFHESVSMREKMEVLGIGRDSDASIPVFFADGLEIVKDGARIKPLFLDIEDLYNAWKRAANGDERSDKSPVIKVYDLPEVILMMESKGAEHANFGFFPATSSIQAVRGVRSQHGTRARPMYRLAPY